ncbi:MAG TPA: LacI family DNA-binding transcriptional regulator [Beutenbergiaceae bacterium]|nr:LacI family DNA-binding transcriptional regulator [Beutenbergiaceae bacterium]
MRRASVRLVDVAAHAGVSLATASRVLNGGKRHSARPEMRERVLAAAEQLGYEPNHHARALAGSASTTIGLVVHDIRDAYFSLIAGAVVRAAEQHGLFVTIVNTYRDVDQEARYIRLLRAQRPRALILSASGFVSKRSAEPIATEARRFEEAGGVVVSIGHHGVGHAIDVGNFDGARRLAHWLASLGHRRFAVVTGQRRLITVRDRVEGFRAGLAERGISLADREVHYGDTTRAWGQQVARELAARQRPPTCVFGTFDMIAAGVVRGFQEYGLQVPADVSVAGFADVPPAADLTPAVTTVRLPLDLVGQQAVELAMRDEPGGRRTISFEGSIIERASTGPAPMH